MKEVTVWIDNWQMLCCGTPFKLGDTVEWTVVQWTFGEPAVAGIGSIDYDYENHGAGVNGVSQLKGIVTEIHSVWQIHDPKTHQAVSGKLVRFDGTANARHADEGEYKFSAYLVRVTI